MARKGKNVTERDVIFMRMTPIDRQLLTYLMEKSFHTQTVTSIIREALAYRAESRGMDVMALFQKAKNENTPA